jgi:hypothetical protein
MKYKVLIKFGSFESRDRWLNALHDHIYRVYKRNPWLAAELSGEELQEVKRQPDVSVFPDSQMSPFMALASP